MDPAERTGLGFALLNKLMSKLEKAAYVSMITVCVTALYFLISSGLGRRKSALTEPQTEAKLIGTPLRLDAAPWGESQRSVVLAITSQCPFCLRSLPLYRKLDKAIRASRPDISLFVVSSEPRTTMEAFLEDEQIKTKRVFHSSLGALGITATPTALIVDRSGIVRHVFVGQLDEAKERELFVQLGLTAATRLNQDMPSRYLALTRSRKSPFEATVDSSFGQRRFRGLGLLSWNLSMP